MSLMSLLSGGCLVAAMMVETTMFLNSTRSDGARGVSG